MALSGENDREESWRVPRVVSSRFAPSIVSQSADNKIADLEQAMQKVLIAKTHPELGEAYSYLNETRKALYSHIAGLEERVGITRTVRKRF